MTLDDFVHTLLAMTARNLVERAARNEQREDHRVGALVEGWKQYIRTKRIPVFVNDSSFEECLLEEAEKTLPTPQVRTGIYDAGLILSAGSAGVCAGADYVPGWIVGLGLTYLFGKAQIRAKDSFVAPRSALEYLRQNPQSIESYLCSAEPLIIKEFRNYGHLTDLCQ